MVHRRTLRLPLALRLSILARLVEGGGDCLFCIVSIIG